MPRGLQNEPAQLLRGSYSTDTLVLRPLGMTARPRSGLLCLRRTLRGTLQCRRSLVWTRTTSAAGQCLHAREA